MIRFALNTCLMLASAASATTIYEAEISLYRVRFDSCSGRGIEPWLASPAEPMPVPTEALLGSIQFDRVPMPLPDERQHSTVGMVAARFEWMPHASLHVGPMILVPEGRTGTVSFGDTTPIQYLSAAGGDEYRVATHDGSPCVKIFATASADGPSNVALRLDCEYSLVTNRETVEGAADVSVGRPEWQADRASISFTAPMNEWVGALVPVGSPRTGSSPVQNLLIPVVRVRARTANGFDNQTEQERIPGEFGNVPPQGYDLAQLPQYSIESKVLRGEGPLEGLFQPVANEEDARKRMEKIEELVVSSVTGPYAPKNAKPLAYWSVVGNASVLYWPQGVDPTTWFANDLSGDAGRKYQVEIENAPRVNSLGWIDMMGASSKVLVKYRGGDVSGVVGVTDVIDTWRKDYPSLSTIGRSLIADWIVDGQAVRYDVRGWGPFRRSKALRADSGILISARVEPTGDPDILRVDYHFINPYVKDHEQPPRTEAEARALLATREFRALYECHEGATSYFLIDERMVAVTVEVIPSTGPKVFTVSEEDVALAAESMKPSAESSQPKGAIVGPALGLQNIEVQGEIRVRGNIMSR